MSRTTNTAAPARNVSCVTPTSLIDELMGVLARGEAALFADLAQAAWSPQATLGQLAGSLSLARRRGDSEPAA